ncbi:DUF1566 domain-containing protein [bacterium]|nr:DUF1566 domain-containing protein [bacterium]
MKKLFVKLSILAAILLIVSCGGGNTQNKSDNNEASDNNDNGAETSDSDKNQEENESQKCESGQFKCVDSESHYCNIFGEWVFDARCKDGCDPATGKCKTDSNDSDIAADTENENDGDYENNDTSDSGDDNDFDNSDASDSDNYSDIDSSNTGSDSDNDHEIPDDSGCADGKYKCSDTGYQSFLCSDGFWNINETCNYGCDFSTGKCKSAECSAEGEFKCDESSSSYTYSRYCNNGLWKIYETCEEGCNSSTGKCKKSCYKIDNKIWSPKSVQTVVYEEALEYCNNLTDCGFSDWHLPTIDELRTLIKNCPETETGGSCNVTDNCLSFSDCYSEQECSSCEESNVEYSKLGDRNIFLWSSSVLSDYSERVCGVCFWDAELVCFNKDFESYFLYVRCVRNAEG